MPDPRAWPDGGGAAGELIRAFDWSRTPLGPTESWPPRLRAAIDRMLASDTPATILWGPDLTQLYNDAFIPIARDRHPAIFGRPVRDNWPEARDFLEPVLERALTDGLPTVFHEQPLTLRGAGGHIEERVFLTAFAPLGDESGKICGVVNALRETTASVRAQQRVRESERRFRAVVDLVPDLLWRSDPSGYTTWYNRRWLEYTGQPEDEAVGWGWTAAIHPEDRDRTQRGYLEGARSGCSFKQEGRLRRRDGEYRWFLVHVSPLLNDEGEVVEWLGAATDVHEERAARATLEQRVEERTSEVRQLAARLTIAEQEERRRISRVLHDELQQLLHAAQMRLAIARDRAGGSAPLSLLEEVGSGLRLLEDAIDCTRHLAADLSPPVLEAEGLLAALRWLRTRMAEFYHLDVEIHSEGDVDPGPHPVSVLLFHAVRELLFNVVKHSGSTRACVEISQDQEGVRIVVSDVGRGFDPGAVDAASVGGGLGLFSVRERLWLQGGDMKIDSAPGRGTRIEIRVPAG